MTPLERKLAEALRIALPYVLEEQAAQHMLDGFGPRSVQPSDEHVAQIEFALADFDRAEKEEKGAAA